MNQRNVVTTLASCRLLWVFFFQAEDGIRDLVRSRGLGDVYKRQAGPHRHRRDRRALALCRRPRRDRPDLQRHPGLLPVSYTHLTLPTSESSVDLGGRRIIKKKTTTTIPVVSPSDMNVVSTR